MINKGQGTQQIPCHITLESYQGSRYLAGGEVGELCGQEDSSPKRPGQQAEKQRW